MRDAKLLVWHTVQKRAFFATPSEITFADPVLAMNVTGAIALFKHRAPDQSATFRQTQLAQLFGCSFSLLRQFVDHGLLPFHRDDKPVKGKPRVYTWQQGLIVALVGAFWRQNVEKSGLREIGEFLAEHVDELVPAAEPAANR